MLFKPDAVFPERLQSLKELHPDEQLNGILLCFYDAILNCNGTLDKLQELESVVDPDEWLRVVTGEEEQYEYPQLGHPASVAAQSGEFSGLILTYLMSFPPVRQYVRVQVLEKITRARLEQENVEAPQTSTVLPSMTDDDSSDVARASLEESPQIVKVSRVTSSFYSSVAIQKPTPIAEETSVPAEQQDAINMTAV